jgi:hypothetical protein
MTRSRKPSHFDGSLRVGGSGNGYVGKKKKCTERELVEMGFEEFSNCENLTSFKFQQKMDIISELERNLQIKIFSYLSPFELCQSQRVCHLWASISILNEIWWRFAIEVCSSPHSNSFHVC